MKNLIEALQLFQRYHDRNYPTVCCHDVLIVVGFKKGEVTALDEARLNDLGFRWSDEYDGWASTLFGSA
jgi:hypothetical protein